jgi:hypothetical protein
MTSTLLSLLPRVVAVALVCCTLACTPARLVVAPRRTPSSATIAVEVSLDPETRTLLAQRIEANRLQSTTDDELQSQVLLQFNHIESQIADLQTTLQADLPRKNLGRVVANADDAAFLLRGVGRLDAFSSLVIAWQLLDTTTSTIVGAGITDGHAFADSRFFADQMLAVLVTLDFASTVATPAPPASAPTAPTHPASTTDGANAWAVVIGIERYRDALPAATFAENDAVAMAAYFEHTLNVPASHIKRLVNERASRADIASAIEEWLPRNARAGARIYVAFSGHGAPDPETGLAYLEPYDADPAFLKTRGYAIDDLTARLSSIKGTASFVFLDACFSGSGERSVLAAGTRPLVPVKPTTPQGQVVTFAAAAPRQTTGGDAQRRQGLFTAHLLDALRGNSDADNDSAITIGEIAAYVTPRVSADARLSNRDQEPVLTLPVGATPTIVLVTGIR